MPAHLRTHLHGGLSVASDVEVENQADVNASHVHLSREDEDVITDIHRILTATSSHDSTHPYAEPHLSFDKFLRAEIEGGSKRLNLGVCFQSISTWGVGEGHAEVKTLGTALLRTLTFQDIYEWTLKPWISKRKPQEGRQLIRDFSGVVRSGEIML